MNDLFNRFPKHLKLKIEQWRAQKNPIFVLQMGRVGSRSITTAVSLAYQQLQLNPPIYHSHYTANYEKVVERARQDLENSAFAEHDIYELDDKVKKTLLSHIQNEQPVKLISLTRDPVARNVSTFFFAFAQFVPDWKEKEAQNLLPANTLNAIFESKRCFIQTAFHWFDEQIKDTIGIDVYAVPFNTNRGWQVYKKGKVELLVLRMEDLYRTGENALHRFLHLPQIRIVKVNTGEERESYELYRRFLTHPISQEYLEMTYATKLARHFYTAEEREQFIQRWRNPKG